MQQEFDKTRLRLEQQVTTLSEAKNKIDLNFKLKTTDLEKEIENLKNAVQQSEEARQKAEDLYKTSDNLSSQKMDAAIVKYQDQISALESEREK